MVTAPDEATAERILALGGERASRLAPLLVLLPQDTRLAELARLLIKEGIVITSGRLADTEE